MEKSNTQETNGKGEKSMERLQSFVDKNFGPRVYTDTIFQIESRDLDKFSIKIFGKDPGDLLFKLGIEEEALRKHLLNRWTEVEVKKPVVTETIKPKPINPFESFGDELVREKGKRSKRKKKDE
ncbi:MAG: hypothetical protein JRI22_12745 [Deltaproteobacteria bacterium]|nr:hypothetical protein [Deltaproteobacteria bacterium]